jgi:hypothetical protein
MCLEWDKRKNYQISGPEATFSSQKVTEELEKYVLIYARGRLFVTGHWHVLP